MLKRNDATTWSLASYFNTTTLSARHPSRLVNMQAARVELYDDDSDLWDALEPIDEPESDTDDFEEQFELPPLAGNAHLKRTLPFTKILGGLSHAEIAIRMRNVIDHMATLKLDVATFLHYLSWNLEIPAHMTEEEGVIRYVVCSFIRRILF